MDILTPQERSERMRRVRGKDTAPERIVRKVATQMGYRYRLHYSAVPGRPDLAFPSRKKVIWVHGCFWHRHDGCRMATVPKSRQRFWEGKFEANNARDQRNVVEARALGWELLIVWQCETLDMECLRFSIARFLGPVRAEDRATVR